MRISASSQVVSPTAYSTLIVGELREVPCSVIQGEVQKPRTVEAIERGEGTQAFRIVAPSAPDRSRAADGLGVGPADVFGFETNESPGFLAPSGPVVAADDDIPF
jgi:hypothetical protein